MDFAKREYALKDAEIISINVPGLLVKPFIHGKIRKLKKEDPILAMAIRKIKKIRVMTVSGGDKNTLYSNFKGYMQKNNYEELLSIHSEEAKVSIHIKMDKSHVKRLLLGVDDEDEQVFIDIKANLDLDELNKLINYFDDKKKADQS